MLTSPRRCALARLSYLCVRQLGYRAVLAVAYDVFEAMRTDDPRLTRGSRSRLWHLGQHRDLKQQGLAGRLLKTRVYLLVDDRRHGADDLRGLVEHVPHALGQR